MQVPASLLNLLRGGAAVAALTLSGCPADPTPTPRAPVAPTAIEVPPARVTPTPVAPTPGPVAPAPVAPTPEPIAPTPVEPEVSPSNPEHDPNYCPPCGRG